MSKQSDSRMWGGRFQEQTDAFVEAFTASIDFDQRLALVDIEGSLAHAKMLKYVGVLTAEELQLIEQGLATIEQEVRAGELAWSVRLEDVHMNLEARLTELREDAAALAVQVRALPLLEAPLDEGHEPKPIRGAESGVPGPGPRLAPGGAGGGARPGRPCSPRAPDPRARA